jgi:hypothetical protein
MGKYEEGDGTDVQPTRVGEALNIVCRQAGQLNEALSDVQKELHIVNERKDDLEQAQKVLMGALSATEDLRMKAAERNTAAATEGGTRIGHGERV